LDACGANLRVCDHQVQHNEYNIDSLNSAPFQRRRLSEQALIEFCEKYGYSVRDAYAHVASAADAFEMGLRAYCGDLSYEKAAKIISDVQIQLKLS
jgi:hypothetical protein